MDDKNKVISDVSGPSGPKSSATANASMPASDHISAPEKSRPSFKPPKSERLKSVLSTLAIILIAPIIAIVLTAYVFQSYEVDGPSMQNTLQNHDRLIVLKVPRTLARITGHAYIPNRGDIIVFVRNEGVGFSGPQTKQLIKRVIGLPGERVVVKNNVLTIYNKNFPNGFQPDKTLEYSKAIGDTPGNVDITVGKDELFVCGDNRVNSLDSRSFGTIKANDVVGKLMFRVYPFKSAEAF